MPVEIYKSFLCPDDESILEAPVAYKLEYAKKSVATDWLIPTLQVLEDDDSTPLIIENYTDGQCGLLIVKHHPYPEGTYMSELTHDKALALLNGSTDGKAEVPSRILSPYEMVGRLVVNSSGDVSSVIIRPSLPASIYSEDITLKFRKSTPVYSTSIDV